jgi:hypothetical protein
MKSPRQSPSQKPSQPSGDANLLLAVFSLVVVSAITAASCAWISGYVLSSFQDSSTMALLITDAGLKSDDAKLEGQLSSATLALQAVRDVAYALGIGAIGVGAAVFIRFRRAKQPHKTRPPSPRKLPTTT